MKKKIFGKIPVWTTLVVILVLLLGGILLGVLLHNGVGNRSGVSEEQVRKFLASDDSDSDGVSEEEAVEWLREFLASGEKDSVEINRTLKMKKGYEVNGSKTVTGKGSFVFEGGDGGDGFRVGEGASFYAEGILVDGGYSMGVGVNVKAGGYLLWKGGSIVRATEYGVFSSGKVEIDKGVIEDSNNWVGLRGGASANLKNVKFYKCGAVGITIDAGAECSVTGRDTVLERTGNNAVRNNGTFIMTDGYIYMTSGYAIDNFATATLSGVKMNRSSGGGSVMNEKGATVTVDNCIFWNNKYHVRNSGTMNLTNCEMEVSGGSAIYNDVGGVLNASDIYIRDSGYHGIYNENATANVKNMKCELMLYNGIACKGKDSVMNLDGFTLNVCQNGIYNMGDADKTFGKIYAKNVKISGADNYNVISLGGVCDITDATLNPSKGTNVYIRGGSSVLDSVKILGTTTSNKAGLAIGSFDYRDPVVTIKGNSEIAGCASRGITNYNKLTIHNCNIHDNNVSGKMDSGTGIYSLGTVYMYGGKIHDNYATKYGGGIRISVDEKRNMVGKLYMYGGSIYNNKAEINGGGVSIGAKKNVFNMYGGSITGNRAGAKGDGIVVNGAFNLYDAASFADNDIYLFSKEAVVNVASENLSFEQMKLVPDSYPNGRVLVQFPSQATAEKLCKKFTTRNNQFTVVSNQNNGVLDNNFSDFDTSYDFSKAQTVTVTNFEQLKKAVESTQTNAAKVILVAADITITDTITQPNWTHIKIIDDGVAHTLMRGTDNLLYIVKRDSHMVLAGNAGLTFDGGALNGRSTKMSMIRVSGFGYFVMENGAALQNAYNTGTSSSAGIRGAAVNLATDGYFVMKGGAITNCSSPVDDTYNAVYCAVYVSTSGSASMKGGVISNCMDRVFLSYNKVYMSGGVIDNCQHMMAGGAAYRGPAFVMTGGTIKNCVSTNAGAAVYTEPSSTCPQAYFLLDGGTITENRTGTALSKSMIGGAVYIHKKATFEFKSGTISNNVAGDNDVRMYGGGIYNQGVANIGKDAVVKANRATLSVGGIYNTGTMTITGAAITDNITRDIQWKDTRYGAASAIYNTGTLVMDSAQVNNNHVGTHGTIYSASGSMTLRNMTITGNVSEATGSHTDELGNKLGLNDRGLDLRVAAKTKSIILSGKVVAEETDWAFRLDADKTFNLADDFSGDSKIKLYLAGNICEGRPVLKGKVTQDTISCFDWTNITEGYYIGVDGCLATYAAYTTNESGEKTWYKTVAEAIADVDAETVINLARNTNENIFVTKNIKLNGVYTITGNLTVAENTTCSLTDTIVDGDAVIGANAVLGVRGDAKIIGTTTFADGAVVAVEDAVTASLVMTIALPKDAEVGDTILTDNAGGSLVASYYLVFDVVYDGKADVILTIGSEGKLEELKEVIKNKETGVVYDALAEAVEAAKEGQELSLLKNCPANDVQLDKDLTISGNCSVSGTIIVANGKTLTLAEKSSVRAIKLAGTEAKVSLRGAWDGAKISDITVNSPADYAAKSTVILIGDVAHNYMGCTVTNAKDYMLYVNKNGNGILVDKAEAVIEETNTRYATLEEAVAAAKEGQTIKLLSNVQLDSQLVIKTPLTITTDGVTDRIITSTYTDAAAISIKSGTAGVVTLAGTKKESRLIIDGQKLSRDGALVLCGDSEETAGNFSYVTFKGGTSSNAGSALYVTKGTADVRNCVFEDNATSNTSGDAGGPGIYVTSTGTASVKDSMFRNNSALRRGGAIFFSGMVSIENCTFEGNTAGNRGGALYGNAAFKESIKISGSSFKKNSAAGGGAIFVSNRNILKITDSTFEGNSALTDFGGAVAMGTSTSEISLSGRVVFKENSAGKSNYGGGAVMVGNVLEIAENAVVSFEKNQAKESLGGAIFFNAANTPVFTLGEGAVLTMTGNSDMNGSIDIAAKKAAEINLKGSFDLNGIYAAAGTMITMSEQAQDINPEEPTNVRLIGTVTEGMQLVTGSSAADTIFVVTADKNVRLDADGYLVSAGASIAITSGNETRYFDSLIDALEAAEDGDIIILMNDITISTGVTITKSVTVTTDGKNRKLIYQPGDSADPMLTVNAEGKNVIFKGVSKDARLILEGTGDVTSKEVLAYLQTAAKVTMEYVTMQNAHTKHGYGAAIRTAVPLDIDACAFANCQTEGTSTSNGNGGAIYAAAKANLKIVGSTFEKCIANYRGGAIFTQGTMTLTGSTFAENTSTNAGGAICASANPVEINSCTFTGNSSKGSFGGAIAFSSASATLNLSGDCTFSKNTAKGAGNRAGGAIMAPTNFNIRSGARVIMTGNECTGYAYGDAISINASSAGKFVVEAGAALYVYDNPAKDDADNDICINGGTAATPVVNENGSYSTTAPVTIDQAQVEGAVGSILKMLFARIIRAEGRCL